MARLVRATQPIDRTARLFDRARSRLVLGPGSEAFFEAFNDVAYSDEHSYRTADLDARHGFFDWEERLVRDFLPRRPATILVGAAGGGRESLALAQLGYSVVAFEPVARLANSLAAVAAAQSRISRSSDGTRICWFSGASASPDSSTWPNGRRLTRRSSAGLASPMAPMPGASMP